MGRGDDTLRTHVPSHPVFFLWGEERGGVVQGLSLVWEVKGCSGYLEGFRIEGCQGLRVAWITTGPK